MLIARYPKQYVCPPCRCMNGTSFPLSKQEINRPQDQTPTARDYSHRTRPHPQQQQTPPPLLHHALQLLHSILHPCSLQHKRDPESILRSMPPSLINDKKNGFLGHTVFDLSALTACRPDTSLDPGAVFGVGDLI